MKLVTVVSLAGLALASPLLVFVLPQLAGGDVSYVVLSGSMSPAFEAGDFIVGEKFTRGDPIAPGDIITWRVGRDTRVTHRVVEVLGEAPNREFVTKGDANDSPDGKPTPENGVIAVYHWRMPLYGFVISLADQPLGKILFIVLPCAVIFAREMHRIYRMLNKRLEAQNALQPNKVPSRMIPVVTRPAAAQIAQGTVARPAVVVQRRRVVASPSTTGVAK